MDQKPGDKAFDELHANKEEKQKEMIGKMVFSLHESLLKTTESDEIEKNDNQRQMTRFTEA